MGRTRKTLSDYLPEGWQQTIFEMSAEGCSDIEIRAHFIWTGHTKTFNHHAWDGLEEHNIEFKTTLHKAEVLCQAWWEKQSRKSLHDITFQTGNWYSNMKNRFGWRDKSEVEVTTKETEKTLEKYGTVDIQTFRKRFSSAIGKNN